MKDAGNIYPGTSIAVVGIAGRFPGARNLREFWRNLRDGVESISTLDDEQLIAAGATQADLANPDYVRAAAMLDDIDIFDASFFGLQPARRGDHGPAAPALSRVRVGGDGECRLVADEFRGSIGVYAGSGMNTYLITIF